MRVTPMQVHRHRVRGQSGALPAVEGQSERDAQQSVRRAGGARIARFFDKNELQTESDMVLTDDVSLQTFMEHLKKLSVTQSS